MFSPVRRRGGALRCGAALHAPWAPDAAELASRMQRELCTVLAVTEPATGKQGYAMLQTIYSTCG